MRSFTREELDIIIAKEDRVSLETMAKFFKCNWKDVYDAYDKETKTERYQLAQLKKSMKVKDGRKAKKQEREENGYGRESIQEA